MITLKTKTKKDFQLGRQIVNDYIYLKLLPPLLGSQSAQPMGYYFAMSEGEEVKLTEFSQTTRISFQELRDLEDMVDSPLADLSTRNIIDSLLIRMHELAIIQVDAEHAADEFANWGIVGSDLELVL